MEINDKGGNRDLWIIIYFKDPQVVFQRTWMAKKEIDQSPFSAASHMHQVQDLHFREES